jgi:transposase
LSMENTAKTPDPTEYSWQERALKAEAELAKALKRLEHLEAQIRLLTAKRFGRSSEKTNKDQLQLFEDVFNEAEALNHGHNQSLFISSPEVLTTVH